MVHNVFDVCLGQKITPIMHVMCVSAGRCDSDSLTGQPVEGHPAAADHADVVVVLLRLL